jgi:hypothetical protein
MVKLIGAFLQILALEMTKNKEEGRNYKTKKIKIKLEMSVTVLLHL